MSSDSNLPEIIRPIGPEATSVMVYCPHCGEPDRLSAAAWCQVNTKGVFDVSPVTAYGVTCEACHCDYCFKLTPAQRAWPEGDTMVLSCPACCQPVAVQLATVREEDLPYRPDTCEECFADFDVYPDGSTKMDPVQEKRHKGVDRSLLHSLEFDPNGARDWPFTTEVEMLLTVPWLRLFEDGTQQFLNSDEEPHLSYSPRLSPQDLESFCETNIEAYRSFHSAHEEALDRRERVPMTPFW